MTKRYYVKRENINTGEVEYQRTKCLDIYTKNKEICWQFSKQGAKGIAERNNKKWSSSWMYDIEPIESRA